MHVPGSSRTVNPLDGDDWTNVTEEGTQTLSNWNAETLTKTVEQSFPKYDSHGNELEYRWIETGVSFGDQDTGFIANADGTASFTIEVTNSEGGTEELAFTSTPTTEKNDDGSYSTTIENTFENVTDQHVDKYWEQADGSLAQIAPSPDYSDGNATVELYQDGQLIGTYTMDGVTDSNSTAIDNLSGATWQETRSYHIDLRGCLNTPLKESVTPTLCSKPLKRVGQLSVPMIPKPVQRGSIIISLKVKGQKFA